ncbi:hypothetical protein, partial [Intestinibacter sp.]|uniref:hypothetical protein n=1 Tax=Intestinibacter sp. TaxID=1965304 RepID=UPI002A751D2E
MADKKKSTSLNAPKVERGVKDALTPGEKPEKKQTPIEQVIGREISEIVKDINFDAKFESIVTAIDSKETENLLPILEKISNKLNPILGALYGIPNINEATSMDMLLSKLGNLDPKLTMFSPINSVLESIYDILTTKTKEGSSNKPEDSKTVTPTELTQNINYDSIIESINDNTNAIIEILFDRIGDIIDPINKLVNINDFNTRTAQIIDAINSFTQQKETNSGKASSAKVLQLDVNIINASGLDPKTIESLIGLASINTKSGEYLESIDKIVSSLSALEALNNIKLNVENIENLEKVLKAFSNFKLDDFVKNSDKLSALDKTIGAFLSFTKYIEQISSLPKKSEDASKNIKILDDVVKQINDIEELDKKKSEKNSVSIKECVKHFVGINMNLILVAVSFPLAYLGAVALEKEVAIIGKVIGKLNKEIAPIDKNAEKNLKALGLVIVAASALLLLGAFIGGYILSHLVEVLAFTYTLSMFILSTVGAFNLATQEMKEAHLNASNFGKILLIAGGLMLLGALLGGFVLEHLKEILIFTVTLSVFIVFTIGAINLATLGMKEASINAKGFVKILLIAGGLMLLGAFLGGFVLKHLKEILIFTVTLSAFILLTLGSINLATRGMKEAAINIKNFTKILLISGTIMLLGGMIMLLYKPLILGSFAFSLSLGLFILLTVGVFNLASKGIKEATFSANQFVLLVGVAALALLIGGLLFAQNPVMTVTTLLFAVYLAFFVGGIVLLFNKYGKSIAEANFSATQFVILVGVASLSLLIGGFLFQQYPWMMLTTLLFGLYLTFFVVGIVSLFNKYNKDISLAYFSAEQFTILVGVAALSLLIGGFLFQQFPWMMLTSLAFGVVLAAFVGAVVFAYKKASKGIVEAKIDALNFAEVVGISAAIMLIGGGLFLAFPGLIWSSVVFGVILDVFIHTIVHAYIFASKHVKNAKKVAIGFGEIV